MDQAEHQDDADAVVAHHLFAHLCAARRDHEDPNRLRHKGVEGDAVRDERVGEADAVDAGLEPEHVRRSAAGGAPGDERLRRARDERLRRARDGGGTPGRADGGPRRAGQRQ